VIASHHRKSRYTAHPLLQVLLAGESERPVSEVRTTLDEKDVRQFIMSQLGQLPGASIQELTTRYVAHLQSSRRLQVEPAEFKPHLEAVVRKMHHDGLVRTTPREDGLYLLLRQDEHQVPG
jgi:hypothetical protein